MLNLLIVDMLSEGNCFFSPALKPCMDADTRACAVQQVQPSRALLRRPDRQATLHVMHTCVHVYICVRSIDFSGPHAPGCLYIRAW